MFANPRTFPCPNCKEIINDSMTERRFCSTPVDRGVASLIADRQAKTNQACSDASFLKTAAVARNEREIKIQEERDERARRKAFGESAPTDHKSEPQGS